MSRQAFEKLWLDFVEQILPGSPNTKLYVDYFKSLSNAAFERLVQACEQGFILPLVVPNQGNYNIDVARNIALGKKYDVEFMQQLRLTDQTTGKEFLTPKKYLVVLWPVRRQAQTLDKKSSIPLDNSQVDDLTDQVTGDSKGSRISLPELQVLNSEGLEKTILELIKIRGGDPLAQSALERAIIDQGDVSLDQLLNLGTRPTAISTASSLLTAMHIGNEL